MENENLTITIPQRRYEELLDIETRVDVTVERIIHDEYIKTEDILRILGTKLALQKADEIREEDKRREEEYRKKKEFEDNSN